jgi:hypothetical protein
MLKIPESVITGFSSFLNEKNIPVTSHNYYLKWLKYYLDYCHKYRFDYLNPSSLPNFLNKLKEKKQTGIQQKQAHESIGLFYEGLFYELIKQKPDLKDMLVFVNQKNNEVKNKEKPRSYGKEHSQVEVKDSMFKTKQRSFFELFYQIFIQLAWSDPKCKWSSPAARPRRPP